MMRFLRWLRGINVGLVGWAILAVIATAWAIDSKRSSDPEIEILEVRIASLRATVASRADTIAGLRIRVRVADSALVVVKSETAADIADADDRAAPVVGDFRQLIAGNPVLEAGFDSVLVVHADQIAARDSALAKQERAWTLARAELRAENEAKDRQIADLQLAVSDAVERGDRLDRKLNPPFLLKLFGDLPEAVGVGACALAGAKIGDAVMDDAAVGAASAATVCRLIL